MPMYISPFRGSRAHSTPTDSTPTPETSPEHNVISGVLAELANIRTPSALLGGAALGTMFVQLKPGGNKRLHLLYTLLSTSAFSLQLVCVLCSTVRQARRGPGQWGRGGLVRSRPSRCSWFAVRGQGLDVWGRDNWETVRSH